MSVCMCEKAGNYKELSYFSVCSLRKSENTDKRTVTDINSFEYTYMHTVTRP